jgi:uncharacterized membrane protein
LIEKKAPSTFDLRVFAALLCPFCALIASWIGRRIGIEHLWLWTGLAILPFSIFGLVRPRTIEGIYRSWTRVTSPIGRAVSVVLLSAIYFLVITPMGWCLRLCGIDAAHRRWDKAAQSYWTDRARRADDSYFHPF